MSEIKFKVSINNIDPKAYDDVLHEFTDEVIPELQKQIGEKEFKEMFGGILCRDPNTKIYDIILIFNGINDINHVGNIMNYLISNYDTMFQIKITEFIIKMPIDTKTQKRKAIKLDIKQ